MRIKRTPYQGLKMTLSYMERKDISTENFEKTSAEIRTN